VLQRPLRYVPILHAILRTSAAGAEITGKKTGYRCDKESAARFHKNAIFCLFHSYSTPQLAGFVSHYSPLTVSADL
jgi:hypothetical protein